MNSILGQSIIAELASEYNLTVKYIETIPTPPGKFATFRHVPADHNNALGQLTALRHAMHIVARQTNVNLILPK